MLNRKMGPEFEGELELASIPQQLWEEVADWSAISSNNISSASSRTSRIRKLRKRIILGIFGLIALVVLVSILVLTSLQKKGKF